MVGTARVDRVAPFDDEPVGRVQISDEELCALALSADPETEVGDDAVSIWSVTGGEDEGPLPAWYMPAAAGGRLLSGWRRVPPLAVIAALIVINCYGLCNTYGQLGFS